MIEPCKLNILMTLIKFQVSKPKASICSNYLLAFIINAYFRSVLVIIIWHYESRNTTSKVYSKPCFAFLNKFEYFLICNSIYISYNQELLVVFHNL